MEESKKGICGICQGYKADYMVTSNGEHQIFNHCVLSRQGFLTEFREKHKHLKGVKHITLICEPNEKIEPVEIFHMEDTILYGTPSDIARFFCKWEEYAIGVLLRHHQDDGFDCVYGFRLDDNGLYPYDVDYLKEVYSVDTEGKKIEIDANTIFGVLE